MTGRILQARLMLLNGGPVGGDRHAGFRLRARTDAPHRTAPTAGGLGAGGDPAQSRRRCADAVEAARGGSRAAAGVRARPSRRADRSPTSPTTISDLGLQLRTLLAHAITLHQSGRREGADQCLDAALDLTAAEGYRLPFLQLGARAHALLIDARVAAARHGSLVAELLGTTAPHGGRGAELTDPLSPRELEVLRHLVAGMDTDEIAGDLFVSRNTVRTHTKSIYRKLSVQNKRDAMLKAAALGIV